jgi:WD40 repeat protein
MLVRVLLIIKSIDRFLSFILDKKEFVAWLKGHTTPVKEISVDSNGDFCITTSAEIAFLWELKTFERKRKLTITNKNDVCLFRVRRFCSIEFQFIYSLKL